jgi:hypothetical protein
MNNDLRVDSWGEFVEALYDFPQNPLQRFRSSLVYRGMADAEWGLETSLARLGGDFANLEKPLLRSFRKYAGPDALPADTLWVLLSVAQHHGLPTRLLDWTLAPRVAAHFATADETLFDRDGAIWCVDIVKARALLPAPLQAILDAEYADIFAVDMLHSIRSLEEFDELAEHGEFLLFFEPPSLDARIVNQGAILSIMPGPRLALGAFLAGHPDLCRRIIIPRALKWEIRDKLDQDNVNERILFPGLDGLSRWLRRYYGPGPNQA